MKTSNLVELDARELEAKGGCLFRVAYYPSYYYSYSYGYGYRYYW